MKKPPEGGLVLMLIRFNGYALNYLLAYFVAFAHRSSASD